MTYDPPRRDRKINFLIVNRFTSTMRALTSARRGSKRMSHAKATGPATEFIAMTYPIAPNGMSIWIILDEALGHMVLQRVAHGMDDCHTGHRRAQHRALVRDVAEHPFTGAELMRGIRPNDIGNVHLVVIEGIPVLAIRLDVVPL